MGIVKKHIAVLCDYKLMPERIGGMDHFFWAFQDACSKRNIAVDWFFPNTTKIENYQGFKIMSSGNTIENTFLKHIQNTETNYTTIFTHFLELCTPFYKKVKTCCTAKIVAVDHNPRPLGGYALKKRLKKKLKGALFSNYIDVFVGVSKYTSKEIIKDFGSQLRQKTITIYNGVQTTDIKKKIKRNHQHPKFLVASHLRESKGIQDLIAAVALLEHTIKDRLQIDIYGDGPYRYTLETLINKAKLQTNFTFKGNVNNLKDVYCLYDYMLQPTHMECFSLSILESLAANVPVITTPVGGNMEVVENGVNGFIIAPKNSVTLSNKIKDILIGNSKIAENTDVQIKMQFSINAMVSQYISLIK